MSWSSNIHKSEGPKKINFAVFTCSTSRHNSVNMGEEVSDISGDTVEFLLKFAGHKVLIKKIIPDFKEVIEQEVKNVLNNEAIDAAVFCGGTGITSLDKTIEAVEPFIGKILPGFGEFFRRLSYDKIGSAALMSRALAGVTCGKALFCIPGSPDAARLSVELLISPEVSHIVKHARE